MQVEKDIKSRQRFLCLTPGEKNVVKLKTRTQGNNMTEEKFEENSGLGFTFYTKFLK